MHSRLSLLFSFLTLVTVSIAGTAHAASGIEEWLLPTQPSGLAVATDGSVFTAHRYPYPSYLLKHRGGDTTRVVLPNELIEPRDLMADHDGGVWILGYEYLGHMARSAGVRVVAQVRAYSGAVGPDGRFWAVDDYGSSIKIVSVTGDVVDVPLPPEDGGGANFAFDLAFDRSGRAWVVSRLHLFRIDADLTVARFDWPEVWSAWICRGPDDTMVTSAGVVAADGTLTPRAAPGIDAALGSDGRAWAVLWRDGLVAIDSDGRQQWFPAAAPRTWPSGLGDSARVAAGVENDIWATTGSSLRRIAVDAIPPTLAPRHGDFLLLEYEPNCCFEGSHVVIALQREGPDAFVLAFDLELAAIPPIFLPDGTIVGVSLSYGNATSSRGYSLVELSPEGAVVRSTGLGLPAEARVGALFAHPNGEIWLLTAVESQIRVDRYDLRFVHTGTSVLPEASQYAPRQFDVESDGCTVGYFLGDGSTLHRFDVCRSVDVADVALDASLLQAFRFLRDGRVLAATDQDVILFGRDGTRERTYGGAFTVALDIQGGFFWAGSPDGRSLRRIDFETGSVWSEMPLYGSPSAVSIFGELRASAPEPPARRRAIRGSGGTSGQ